MVVEIDKVINEFSGLLEGGNFLPVNAPCFENGEKFSAIALS